MAEQNPTPTGGPGSAATVTAPPRPSRMPLLALAGLLVTVAGAVSWMFLLENPWIRRTAIPNIAIVVIGSSLAVYAAVRHHRVLTILMATAAELLSIGFILAVFVLMRLPPAETVAVGAPPPDFTLPDQNDRAVTLSLFRGQGPVLLVFYRGFW